VIDLARSIDFRAGHIPGAIWGVRTRLAELAPRLAGAKTVVVACPDGRLSALAHAEAAALAPAADTLLLAGGTAAWRAEGRPMAADKADPPDGACVDFYLRPYDRNTGVEEAMNAYLTWEIDLADEIKRDPTIHFGTGHFGAGAH
jgi:rhodanese-related sulfurtransferase